MEVITDSNHNVEEVKIGMLCTGEVKGAGFELSAGSNPALVIIINGDGNNSEK